MNSFWNFLLEASIGLALVWMVHWLFLRKLTFFAWSRFFLLAGVVLSLVFPILDFDLFSLLIQLKVLFKCQILYHPFQFLR